MSIVLRHGIFCMAANDASIINSAEAKWDFNNILTSDPGNITLSVSSGSASYDTGKINNAIKGNNSYYLSGDVSSFLEDTWSISFFYYYLHGEEEDQGLFATSKTESDSFILYNKYIGSPATPRLYLGYYNKTAGTLTSNDIEVTMPTDNWYHICLTYNNNTEWTKVYFNNSLAKTVGFLSFAGITSDGIIIGGSSLDSGLGRIPFLGKIDLFYVFDFELSTDQISELYNAGAGM